jgi:hypothetical protein
MIKTGGGRLSLPHCIFLPRFAQRREFALGDEVLALFGEPRSINWIGGRSYRYCRNTVLSRRARHSE